MNASKRTSITATRTRLAVITAVLLLALVVLPGCGGGEESSDGPPRARSPQDVPVGPFATAQGLLAEYNSRAEQDPRDMPGILELVYAENEEQASLVALYRDVLPALDLAGLVRQRFDASMRPSMELFDVRPDEAPARLVDEGDDRAQALATRAGGRAERLYLLRIDGRWWLSGFTLEYGLPEGADEAQVAIASDYFRLHAAVAPAMSERLLAGQFESVEAFRAALDTAVAEHLQRHRRDYPALTSAE